MKAICLGKTTNGWVTVELACRLDGPDFNAFRALVRGLGGLFRNGINVFPKEESEVRAAFLAAGYVERRALRGPETPNEEWARRGLLTVAGLDPDRAREENGVGFSKFDGAFGHDIAEKAQGLMSDKQWETAVRLANKYRRQIGEAPEPIAKKEAVPEAKQPF